VRLFTLAPGDVFNPSTWNSYNEEERAESVKYGIIESESIAKVVGWILTGKLKFKYEMKVNVDTGEIIDQGKYQPLKNGDVIVVDAKTIPKLFESVGENYKAFVPQGYERFAPK
jgi:hypothetical protein